MESVAYNGIQTHRKYIRQLGGQFQTLHYNGIQTR